MDPVLTIGEISRRSGVASSALRFYEERGLIASVRAGSGHRRYRFCAKDRLLPRGNRRRACQAPIGPHSHPGGLDAIVGGMDETDRSTYCGTSAAESRPDAMHRMRMPL